MNEQRIKNISRLLSFKRVFLFAGVLVISVFFIFNLFRTPSYFDVIIVAAIVFSGVSYVICSFLRKKLRVNLKSAWILIFLFTCAYLLSTAMRFTFISNNIRRWHGLVYGHSHMTNHERRKLDIDFPENTKILYYVEGIPWVEQSAKLIALVDQEDLPKILENFKERESFTDLKSEFWYLQYLCSKKKALYEYSKYVNLHIDGGGVTGKVLVTLDKNDKAKIYMDIIYW